MSFCLRLTTKSEPGAIATGLSRSRLLAFNELLGAPDEITRTQHSVNLDVRVNQPRSGGMMIAPGERAQRA